MRSKIFYCFLIQILFLSCGNRNECLLNKNITSKVSFLQDESGLKVKIVLENKSDQNYFISDSKDLLNNIVFIFSINGDLDTLWNMINIIKGCDIRMPNESILDCGTNYHEYKYNSDSLAKTIYHTLCDSMVKTHNFDTSYFLINIKFQTDDILFIRPHETYYMIIQIPPSIIWKYDFLKLQYIYPNNFEAYRAKLFYESLNPPRKYTLFEIIKNIGKTKIHYPDTLFGFIRYRDSIKSNVIKSNNFNK